MKCQALTSHAETSAAPSLVLMPCLLTRTCYKRLQAVSTCGQKLRGIKMACLAPLNPLPHDLGRKRGKFGDEANADLESFVSGA